MAPSQFPNWNRKAMMEGPRQLGQPSKAAQLCCKLEIPAPTPMFFVDTWVSVYWTPVSFPRLAITHSSPGPGWAEMISAARQRGNRGNGPGSHRCRVGSLQLPPGYRLGLQ